VSHEWKFKNFKFPSPLPSEAYQNVIFMSIKNKQEVPEETKIEEIYKIFGRRMSTAIESIKPYFNEEDYNTFHFNEEEGLNKRIYRSSNSSSRMISRKFNKVRESHSNPLTLMNNTMRQ
jgi:hypothetical protein